MANNKLKVTGYTAIVILAICIVALVGWFVIKWGFNTLNDVVVEIIPEKYEASLGEMLTNVYFENESLCNNPKTKAVLQKCSDVIKDFDTTGNHKYTFKIYIIEDSIKNAFALPGGYIAIYRGLLNDLTDESELWGLLAHESGHVYLRHSLKKVMREMFFAIVISSIFGDMSGLSSIIINNANNILQLSYDREQEKHADLFAFDAVTKNRIDPNGIISLFNKLTDSTQVVPEFLSTHPDMKERIKILAEKNKHNQRAYSRILSKNEWDDLKRIHKP